MTTVKRLAKEAGKFAALLLCMVLAGYLLLVAVYAIPTDRIQANVQASYEVFASEETYPKLIPGRWDTALDNFTDAWMFLIAENESTEGVFKDALYNYSLRGQDLNPVDTLISLHDEEDVEYSLITYTRYWHGYLIYLKPLLFLFNYGQIRYLLIALDLALIAAVVYLMGRKGKCLLPLGAALFLLNPAVCSLSLQFTPVLVLTLLQFIVILLFEEKYKTDFKYWLYHFFVVGCLTSYFDLLAYPAVTFGVPIVFMVSQYSENFRDALKKTVGSGILWALGYGLMWASKWVLGSIILQTNIISNAWSTMLYRTSSSDSGIVFTAADVIRKNLSMCKPQLKLICLAFAVCIVITAVRKRLAWDMRALVVLCIGALPFVWYTVLSNHSYIHCWMAYRELAISVYALMTIASMVSMKPKQLGDCGTEKPACT